jgi:hypothetical protein
VSQCFPPSPVSPTARLLSAVANGTLWTCTATTPPPAQLTQVQPRLFFYRPTGRPRRTAAGMSSQNYQTDTFRFKRAAFLQSLKSKIGLAASKAAALRINLNIPGCGIVAAPVHAPSRAPLLLPLLLSHNIPPPRSLVRDRQTSPLRPRLVVSRSTCPPLSPSPHANSFVIGPAVINTHTVSKIPDKSSTGL